jgi:hypothetical protein
MSSTKRFNMKKLLSVVVIFALAGCATQAVTTDIASDKVKVLQLLTTKDADVLAEATRSCGIYGKKPVPVSVYEQDFKKVHLFACQ